MFTLENHSHTFRIHFSAAGPDQIRVSELACSGGTWQERQAIIVSADRAVTLKSFALRHDFQPLT